MDTAVLIFFVLFGMCCTCGLSFFMPLVGNIIAILFNAVMGEQQYAKFKNIESNCEQRDPHDRTA